MPPPPRTKLAAIAAAAQSTHDAFLAAAVARCLMTYFPEYFDTAHPNYINDDVFKENFTPFIQKNLRRHPMFVPIQRHRETIKDPNADDLSFANEIITYLQERLAKPGDEWETANYYESRDNPPSSRNIKLPNQRVFYCVFQLLHHPDFLDPALSPEKQQQEADQRVFDFAREMMQFKKEAAGKFCDTGFRHWLMLPLQGKEIYVTGIKHTIYFPLGTVEDFIDEQIQNLLEFFFRESREKDFAHWISLLHIWLKPETERPANETQQLNEFISSIHQYLNTVEVIEKLSNTLFVLGVDTTKYTGIIREKISLNSLLSLTPHYPDTLLSHIREVIELEISTDPTLALRNTQLQALQDYVRSGNFSSQEACDRLAAKLASFFDIESLHNNLKRYASALSAWNAEEFNAEPLMALLQEYPHRGMDQIILSPAEKQEAQRFRELLSRYQSDTQTTNITNFFAVLFALNTTEEKQFHSAQAHDPIFQEKFRLSDEKIRQLIRRAGPDGTLDITPYEVNRVFLHALSMPIPEWTELFSGAFTFVLEYVTRSLGREHAQGLHSNLKANSYPKDFLNLLQWMHRVDQSPARPDIRLSEERDKEYKPLEKVSLLNGIGQMALISDDNFVKWLRDSNCIIEFVANCLTSIKSYLNSRGLLNFSFHDITIIPEGKQGLKASFGSIKKIIEFLGLEKFERQVAGDLDSLCSLFYYTTDNTTEFLALLLPYLKPLSTSLKDLIKICGMIQFHQCHLNGFIVRVSRPGKTFTVGRDHVSFNSFFSGLEEEQIDLIKKLIDTPEKLLQVLLYAGEKLSHPAEPLEGIHAFLAREPWFSTTELTRALLHSDLTMTQINLLCCIINRNSQQSINVLAILEKHLTSINALTPELRKILKLINSQWNDFYPEDGDRLGLDLVFYYLYELIKNLITGKWFSKSPYTSEEFLGILNATLVGKNGDALTIMSQLRRSDLPDQIRTILEFLYPENYIQFFEIMGKDTIIGAFKNETLKSSLGEVHFLVYLLKCLPIEEDRVKLITLLEPETLAQILDINFISSLANDLNLLIWFRGQYPAIISSITKDFPALHKIASEDLSDTYVYLAIRSSLIQTIDELKNLLAHEHSFVRLIMAMDDAQLQQLNTILKTPRAILKMFYRDSVVQAEVFDSLISFESRATLFEKMCKILKKSTTHLSPRTLAEILCDPSLKSDGRLVFMQLFSTTDPRTDSESPFLYKDVESDEEDHHEAKSSEDFQTATNSFSLMLTKDLLRNFLDSCPAHIPLRKQKFSFFTHTVNPATKIVNEALDNRDIKSPEDYVRTIKDELEPMEKDGVPFGELNYILELIAGTRGKSVDEIMRVEHQRSIQP